MHWCKNLNWSNEFQTKSRIHRDHRNYGLSSIFEIHLVSFQLNLFLFWLFYCSLLNWIFSFCFPSLQNRHWLREFFWLKVSVNFSIWQHTIGMKTQFFRIALKMLKIIWDGKRMHSIILLPSIAGFALSIHVPIHVPKPMSIHVPKPIFSAPIVLDAKCGYRYCTNAKHPWYFELSFNSIACISCTCFRATFNLIKSLRLFWKLGINASVWFIKTNDCMRVKKNILWQRLYNIQLHTTETERYREYENKK